MTTGRGIYFDGITAMRHDAVVLVGESGLQYLFGIAVKTADGQLRYDKKWAYSPAEEKSGFEWFVDFVMARRREFPTMHVYHFGGYEPGAFKRLMGLYATREEEIDSMLRANDAIQLVPSACPSM